jgi:hypothetical protein
MRIAALLILLASGPAAAHDYPIKPVQIVLRVEPDRVVADVDSDSIYWIEEIVGLTPMPPRDWPADARVNVEKYVNAHLRLSAGGRRLAGRLIGWSYVQRPWQVYEQGRFRLRLAYPAAADGETLTGEADFFENYRQERLKGKEPLLPIMDFRALVSVPGSPALRFELKPGSVAFSVPVAAARRGAAARFLESLRAGAAAVLDAAEGWAALAALALSLAPGAPSRRRSAGLVAAAVAGAALPAAAGVPWLAWAAGAAAALAAGRWLSEASAPWLEAAAAAALARAWSLEALVALPRSSPGPLERTGAALGLLAVAAAALAAGLAAATAARRAAAVHSESRASELFERRRRLAATALLVVCGGGLIASFPGITP